MNLGVDFRYYLATIFFISTIFIDFIAYNLDTGLIDQIFYFGIILSKNLMLLDVIINSLIEKIGIIHICSLNPTHKITRFVKNQIGMSTINYSPKQTKSFPWQVPLVLFMIVGSYLLIYTPSG